MDATTPRELRAEDLTWRLPETCAGLDLTAIAPAADTIGQDRAVASLDLGLSLRAPGYNVFVAGANGTGRTSTVHKMLETMRARHVPVLRDRAYVHDFTDPTSPRLLTFPAGKAREFRRDMQQMIQHLREHIPSILEEESFRKERERIQQEAVDAEREMVASLEKDLQEHGFSLIQLRAGNVVVPEILPMVGGRPVDWEKIERLAKEGKLKKEALEQLQKNSEAMHEHMESVFKRLRSLALEVVEKIRRVERKAVEHLTGTLIGEIRERYATPAVHAYLGQVQADVLEELDAFKQPPRKEGTPDLAAMLGKAGGHTPEDVFPRYEVNVLLDNTGRSGCPVVVEDLPTWSNLFGTVEVEFMHKGTPHTDFMRIRAGSLLKADGGFLVLNALDLLISPGAWPALKRVLKTGRLEIHPPELLTLWGTLVMKPEAIDIDVKVVLIGEPWLYRLLYLYEDDFKTIFKVKAEFDHEMPFRRDTLEHFVAVLRKVADAEKLLPMEPGAWLVLIEEAVRRAGRRYKLSTRFGELCDVAREAAWSARQEQREAIGPDHVRRAIRAQDRRNDLADEKISEWIDRGVIHLDCAGERVGQVNGLSVYDLGDYSFGKPARITATVAVGRAGIINIEREAGLSGHSHDKGVLILAGYLRQRYAQQVPLALSASLCFEQSYGGVDGDSASSTEVYALLSALSGVPLRQALAVTGSVDQHGLVQAIGGVNEKIEGFFKVCRARGLTGDQGVLLPRTNVEDLVLRSEVVEAVAAGKFHLWPVETIDEGIALLTGRSAAEIHERAQQRLREFARALVEFEKSTAESGEAKPAP